MWIEREDGKEMVVPQNSGDVIYRQDAIDFIDAGSLVNPNEPRWSDNEVVAFLKSRPSAQPEPYKDAVSKAEVLEIYADLYDVFDDNKEIQKELDKVFDRINELPSAQPTLYGYNIEHLVLIARVLQKENFPPERITEMLTDIGRFVAIVIDEYEESLRKAVEQCVT